MGIAVKIREGGQVGGNGAEIRFISLFLGNALKIGGIVRVPPIHQMGGRQHKIEGEAAGHVGAARTEIRHNAHFQAEQHLHPAAVPLLQLEECFLVSRKIHEKVRRPFLPRLLRVIIIQVFREADRLESLCGGSFHHLLHRRFGIGGKQGMHMAISQKHGAFLLSKKPALCVRPAFVLFISADRTRNRCARWTHRRKRREREAPARW